MPKMTIVVTTINVPSLLEGFASSFERYGHLGDASVIVVGDRKTPHAENADLARRLAARGLACEYMDLASQASYMSRFPELDRLLPFDSDQRRNIGYLKALEEGAEIVVALDDDNLVGEDDWFAAHSLVGQTVTMESVSTPTRWFNPCAMMDTDPPGRILYPRGHPYSRRHRAGFEETRTAASGRVVVNAGLWLLEPDVDSLTRLTEPVRCTGLRERRLMVEPGTWAAINTQNTAVHRDAMPAFYFVPITGRIGGVVVERYGDIWAGFFLRKAIDRMGDRVVYGEPACYHQRNPHVLLKDMLLEFWAIHLTEELWEDLDQVRLTATSYVECYEEIAAWLEAKTWRTVPLAGEVRAYFQGMAAAMKVWAATIRRIGV